MLKKTGSVHSLLECGCNVGRNINFLNYVLPKAEKNIIEISPEAFEIVTKRYRLNNAFNGAIADAPFEQERFDLVYTMGVLIHIHPEDLPLNMKKMYDSSKKYILMGEYFSRTPVRIDYQDEQDKLFKSDFGKTFMEHHDVKLLDYGFLWGHLYDKAGFDDITWWLFEKK